MLQYWHLTVFKFFTLQVVKYEGEKIYFLLKDP